MGHRHSPQAQCGDGSFFRPDHGTAQALEILMTSGALSSQNVATPCQARSLGVRLALFALRCYKVYLSVLFAGTCRFEPTCSQYAYHAIERFGVFRGVWLGAKRLSRCHPFSGRFGYDPVPESFSDGAHHQDSNPAAAQPPVDRPAPIRGSGFVLTNPDIKKDGIRL